MLRHPKLAVGLDKPARRTITNPELLRAMFRARCAGERFFTVCFTDDMSPFPKGRGENFSYDPRTIEEIVRGLCRVASIASGHTVYTMAPDERDHKSCPPEVIRKTWVPLLKELASGFLESQIVVTERNEFYRTLMLIQKPFDFVLKTGAMEDYGNVAITFDLRGGLLADISSMPVELFMALAHGNHSARIMILPNDSLLWRGLIPKGVNVLTMPNASVADVANIVSTYWLPDLHDQAFRVSQLALQIYTPNLTRAGGGDRGALEEFQQQLDKSWRGNEIVGFVDQTQFLSHVNDPVNLARIQIVVICEKGSKYNEGALMVGEAGEGLG